MINTWNEVLDEGGRLLSLYSEELPLEPLRLRSLHLSRYGPSAIIRADFMRFPDLPPEAWVSLGLDCLQVHLKFLAIDDVRLPICRLPDVVSISMDEMDARRMRVGFSSSKVEFYFSASCVVDANHISAYKQSGDPLDSGRHAYLSKLEQRLYDVVPDPTVARYHDRP